MEIYSVNFHIQFEWVKILTRKTPNTDTFYVENIMGKVKFMKKKFQTPSLLILPL